MANGSSIPSGGAPLFLGDFATPTYAVGQKMNERMIARSKEDQTRRGKERTAMLEAFNWTAVEGLSQKVSMEHLDKMNGLIDEFSERWLANGKKLEDKDYLDLQKAKLEMQQDIANKKYNVAQFAYAQKQVLENSDMWDPESLDRVTAFKEAGDVGRDASQLLVPKFNLPRYLYDLQKNIKVESTDSTSVINPEGTGMIDTISNEKGVREEYGNAWDTDPTIQYQIQKEIKRNPGKEQEIRKQYADDKERWIRTGLNEDIEYRGFDANEFKQNETLRYNDKWKDNEKAQILLKQGVPDEDINAGISINDSLNLLLQGDEATIESLRGYSDWQYIDRAERRPNGDIRLIGKIDKATGKRPTKDFYVSEAKTEADKRRLMESMAKIGIADLLTGKQQPDNIFNMLVPSGWDVSPKKTGLPGQYSGAISIVKRGDKINTKQATALLADLYPETKKAEDRTSTGWPVRWAKDYGIKWKSPGATKEKEYIWKEGGDKELLNDIAKDLGYDQPFPEIGGKENPPAVTPEPVEEKGKKETPPPVESTPTLTPEAQQKVKKVVGQFGSYDEMINDEISNTGKSRAEVEKKVQKLGITPDMWDTEKKKIVAPKDSTIISNIKKDPEVIKSKVTKPPAVNITQSELDALLSRKAIIPKELENKKEYKEVKTSVKIVDAPEIDSETFKGFKSVIGNPKYSQEHRYDIGFDDCSSAICKMMGIKNTKDAGVSAQDIYSGKTTKNNKEITESVPEFIKNAKDGQLVFFNADFTNDKGKPQGIDHVGMVAVDNKTGKKYLVEVAKNKEMDGAYVSPLTTRINSLKVIGSKIFIADKS